MEGYLGYGTGRRKKAVARVWLKAGKGEIIVNKRPLENYFPLEGQQEKLKRPLAVNAVVDKYDVLINLRGGGISGQVDAAQLGLARALLQANEEFKTTLKRAGLLKRDTRIKERKKYGQRGARARFQYSKR